MVHRLPGIEPDSIFFQMDSSTEATPLKTKSLFTECCGQTIQFSNGWDAISDYFAGACLYVKTGDKGVCGSSGRVERPNSDKSYMCAKVEGMVNVESLIFCIQFFFAFQK